MNKTAKFIIKEIKDATQIDITDKCRKRDNAYLRAIYYVLMQNHTKLSISRIAKFVNKDHCAVIHSNNKIFNEAITYESHIKDLYEYLNTKLNNKEMQSGVYQLNPTYTINEIMNCINF